jgi:7,8-dihydro-6-hydroxymethylpterin-pyrophosphokinase
VAEIATELPPRALKFEVLRPIEAELGRRREEDRYAPRPIDLDLLLYDDVLLTEEGLVLPDPELWSRPFLAHPLHELAPGLVLPGGEAIADVAARLPREEMHPLPEYTERVREALHHEP